MNLESKCPLPEVGSSDWPWCFQQTNPGDPICTLAGGEVFPGYAIFDLDEDFVMPLRVKYAHLVVVRTGIVAAVHNRHFEEQFDAYQKAFHKGEDRDHPEQWVSFWTGDESTPKSEQTEELQRECEIHARQCWFELFLSQKAQP